MSDPRQAAAILTDGDVPVRSLLGAGPKIDPSPLAEVLFTAGDEKSRSHLEWMANYWMRNDRAAAVSWAAAHDGALLETFLSRLANDPAALLDSASVLPAEKRVPALESVVRNHWNEYDPNPVVEAIRASRLPEEEKQKLIQSLTPPP